jgi:hypothetical protein
VWHSITLRDEISETVRDRRCFALASGLLLRYAMQLAFLNVSRQRLARRAIVPMLEVACTIAALVALRVLRWQLRAAQNGGPREPATSKPFADGERDLVDECSWESFPASDPPAFSGRGRR